MKFLKEIAFIFLVGFFFAGLTAAVNYALESRVSLNEKTRNSRYLLEVLGIDTPEAADPEIIRDMEKRRIKSARIKGHTIYRSYDEKGQPNGYAFRFSGKGFWGNISGLMALKNDLDSIKGIIFTSQNETPGLGARIDEDWFRRQFKGIKLSQRPEKGKFITIRSGKTGGKNTVDAITGATMTSSLLEKLLNKNIQDIVGLKEEIRRTEWPSPREK
jgi:Na+-transporting NADH:ubiquinone oxidoreductase subunit C